MKISIVKAIRNNLNIPFTNNCDKNFSQAPLCTFPRHYRLVDINEPLLANLGFYRTTTTTVEGFAVDIVSICFDEQTLGCQLLNNFRSCFLDGHPCEFSSICQQAPLKVDNLFLVQLVSLCDLKVGVIVPRSDRHHSCAKGWIHDRVLDDRSLDRPIDPFTLKGIPMVEL